MGEQEDQQWITSQLEQEKGPGPAQPPLSCAPSCPFFPSSLLCFFFPESLGEAQVAEHPLAEGINTLN